MDKERSASDGTVPLASAMDEEDLSLEGRRHRYTLPTLRYVNIVLAVIFIDGAVSVVLWLTGMYKETRYTGRKSRIIYHNFPKFSDRQVWANSADPDQTAPSSLISVYTVCHSVCIVWTQYSMVEQHSSNLRVIITNILGVRIFRKFMVVIIKCKFSKFQVK